MTWKLPKCSSERCHRGGYQKHGDSWLCSSHWLRAAGVVPKDKEIEIRIPRGGPRLPCCLPGCGRPLTAKGLCKSHYQKRRRGVVDWDKPVTFRTTDPTPARRLKLPADVDRFISRRADASGVNAIALIREVLTNWVRDQIAQKEQMAAPIEWDYSGREPDVEDEVLTRIIRRMVTDEVDVDDICQAIPSLSRVVIEKRVSRFRAELRNKGERNDAQRTG